MENEPPRYSYNEVAEMYPDLDDREILKLFEDSLKALQEYRKNAQRQQPKA